MIIGNKYEIGDPLGQGTYSSVHHANDREGHLYAVKIESAKAPKSVIRDEARIYRRIRYCAISKMNGCYPLGLPKAYHYEEIPQIEEEDNRDQGEHGGPQGATGPGAAGNQASQRPKVVRTLKVLVMERLGDSLCYVQSLLKRALSVPSVLMLGIQILHRLEALHEMNIVHRDIKPENILTGYGVDFNLYLCDFGLSRIFRNEYREHIPDIFGESFSGLHHFASLNAHLGNSQSQCDDLESLGYCMIYFAKLWLPWQRRSGEPALDDNSMGEMKRDTTTEELCAGLPNAFHLYMDEVKKLKFMAQPNYVYLRTILHNDMVRIGGEEPTLDWAV